MSNLKTASTLGIPRQTGSGNGIPELFKQLQLRSEGKNKLWVVVDVGNGESPREAKITKNTEVENYIYIYIYVHMYNHTEFKEKEADLYKANGDI